MAGTAAAPAGIAELSEVLQSRADFYEMLAGFYFYPLTQEQIDSLAEIDFMAYADINDQFASGANDISRALHKRHTGTRELLAIDYTAAFEGRSTYEGAHAAPYKSVFTSKEGLMMQEGYQEVYRAYKEQNIKRKDGFDWPEDHLSFLFQFMALLSRRVDEALQQGDADTALRLLRTSRQFLEDHIDSWFDPFAQLASKLVKTRFYKGVLKITKGYIMLDYQTIDDLIAEIDGQRA